MAPPDATTNPRRGQGRLTRSGSRLGQFQRYEVALAYALGNKVEWIAAKYGITHGYLPRLVRDYGLRARGRGRLSAAELAELNRSNEARLRAWARNRAAALRREATAWEALAELE